MKKLFAALGFAFIIAFGVAGCNADTDKLQSKIDELQNALNEMSDTLSEMDEKIDGLERELAQKLPGTVFTLQEAFDGGLITKEDLMSIAYHYDGRNGNEEIMGEDYTPLPKTLLVLDEITELKIKCAMAEKLRDNSGYIEDVEGFHIEGYYGTYNGCVAFIGYDDYMSIGAAETSETVEGVNFTYPARRMAIWKDVN